MVGTGKGKNKRTGSLLLLILFVLGLASLALPEAAESGAATAWVRSYNAGHISTPHGGGIAGRATAMVVDGQGNVHVAGSYRYVTLKYGPNGRRLWGRRLKKYVTGEPQAMALDGQGHVLVTGVIGYWFGSGSDYGSYATVKYDADGLRLWTRFHDGPNAPFSPSWDAARAIAVDGQGNVLVTGESWTPETHSDYLTIKYGPDGLRLWLRRYNGGFSDWGYGYSDGATAIAVDGQGNVYVTGSSPGGYNHYDIVTLKYSPDGQMLWLQRYNGPANGSDNASAIAVDAQGNVYVTGRSNSGSEWDYAYATIKYDTDGQVLWERRTEWPGTSYCYVKALVVDQQGNVYVTGSAETYGIYSDYDYATVKYSPDGEELWVRHYDGPANDNDYAHAMALDVQGNVYVTGASYGGANSDFATVKYSPDGETLWVMRYDGPGNRSDSASAIAVDGQGQVYVTGTSVNYGYMNPIDSFYVTIKYLQSPRTGR